MATELRFVEHIGSQGLRGHGARVAAAQAQERGQGPNGVAPMILRVTAALHASADDGV